MKKEQEEVDKIYERMVNMYHSELSSFLKEVKPTQRSKRAIRHTKKNILVRPSKRAMGRVPLCGEALCEG